MLNQVKELIKNADKKDKFINLNNNLYPIKKIKQLLKTFKRWDKVNAIQNQRDFQGNLSLTISYDNGFINFEPCNSLTPDFISKFKL